MKPSQLRSLSVIESQKTNGSLAVQDHKNIKEKMSSEEKRLIIIILFVISTIWTLYGNIATFFPPYRLEHHKSITDTQVGIVLAMFECGILITTPLVGKYLAKVGRKNFIIIGYICCMLASTGFGLLVYIKDDVTFFASSISLRLLQGFGDASVSTACNNLLYNSLIIGMSIVASEYPKRREQMYGYTESAIGAGLMLGPVIGQALYSALDFEYTFYVTTAIIFVPFMLVIFFIPNRINKQVKDQNADSMTSSQKIQNNRKVGLKMLLTNKRVMMASISSIFAMIFMLFYDTILSDQLLEIGVSKNLVGYMFGLMSLIYTLSSPIAGWLCQKLKKIYITQLAFILASISLFFFGPSQLLSFPDQLWPMIIGMILLGFACALIFVPLLPEIIDAVQDKEKLGENDELNDKASSLFNISYAIGCLIAPILGGVLNDSIRFRYTCDVMAVSAGIFSVLYFLINVLPFIIHERKQRKLLDRYQNVNIKKDKLIMNVYDSNLSGEVKVLDISDVEKIRLIEDRSYNNQNQGRRNFNYSQDCGEITAEMSYETKDQ
eukprot:403360434